MTKPMNTRGTIDTNKIYKMYIIRKMNIEKTDKASEAHTWMPSHDEDKHTRGTIETNI